MNKFFYSLVLLLSIASCGQQLRSIGDSGEDDSSGGSEASPLASSGDIVVSNYYSDSVLLLDSDGFYKALIYNVANNAESLYGVEYNPTTNEAIIGVDGSDRVVGVSLTDSSVRNVITDANLSGTIRGIAQLISGDYLILESNNVERFTSSGFRNTTGWPIATIQSNPGNIFPLANGGFGVCSYGTDVIRTYDAAGTQVATASSGIAGTTNAYGCIEMSNGNIAVTWNGTTDTVQILSSDLSTVNSSFSNTAVLPSPYGIAQDNDGNLLVTDITYHHIVVLDSSGTLVNVKGNSVLSYPRDLFVVP